MNPTTETDGGIEKRDISFERPVQDGFVAEVRLWDDGPIEESWPPEKIGQYAFVLVEFVNECVDEVRGEPPATAGAVFYIGDNFGKHYWTSYSVEGVPVDVLEAIRDRDLTLLANVDGGWVRWEGRPEFSDKYVDYTGAEIVDLDAVIAERRE